MKKAKSSSAAVILVLAAAAFLFYRYYYSPRMTKSKQALKTAAEKFVMRSILVDPILVMDRRDNDVLDITARMPARYTPAGLKKTLEEFAAHTPGASVECKAFSDTKTESLSASFETPFSPACKFRFIRSKKPKIAIILDDWGYNRKGLKFLPLIKQPFTISVLPDLAYSVESAKAAHGSKKAVMLHLPMQAKGNARAEKTTILAGMSRERVSHIADSLTRDIPYFTGVNNHEGSLATEDLTVMKSVVHVLKEKNLFFIDSLTSSGTIAWKTAAAEGALWGKRDVFIDNSKEPGYIAEQMMKLRNIAVKNGWSIGIGHDDPVTLGALSGLMPAMEEQGVEFVYAAEVLQ
ncbi:MAG: divergent polysaccharide deacetylase family protein [Spirochaetia bacterium]|nr:divergent polysaccharide deacetylase family protein [Spirochaetia bacterium]